MFVSVFVSCHVEKSKISPNSTLAWMGNVRSVAWMGMTRQRKMEKQMRFSKVEKRLENGWKMIGIDFRLIFSRFSIDFRGLGGVTGR